MNAPLQLIAGRHRCPVGLCGERDLPEHRLACERHWRMIPPALRDMIVRLRNGGKPLAGYEEAVLAAVRQAEDAEANGGRMV